MTESKSALRRRMRAVRRRLPDERRERQELAVAVSLEKVLLQRRVHALAAFRAMPSECGVESLLKRWWHAKHPVWLPRVIGPGAMTWHAVEDDKHCLSGFHGIREPDPAKAPESQVPDGAMVCVPGVAFDLTGARLGMGGGYFDSVMGGLRERGCLLVGVCFRCQLIETIPVEAHDQRVDALCADGEWVIGPPMT